VLGFACCEYFHSNHFIGLTFAAWAIFDEFIEAWNSKNHLQFADLCVPWIFVSHGENLVFQALEFQ
jgi:hypothetical protein